jgi:hypothetical protein
MGTFFGIETDASINKRMTGLCLVAIISSQHGIAIKMTSMSRSRKADLP